MFHIRKKSIIAMETRISLVLVIFVCRLKKSRALENPDDKEILNQSATPNSCEQYNSLVQRLSWAERDKRCSREPHCEFRGWRLTGECIHSSNKAVEPVVRVPTEADTIIQTLESADAQQLPLDQQQIFEPAQKEPPQNFNLSTLENFAQRELQDFKDKINEQIKSEVKGQIRESQQAANDLAKSMIQDILAQSETKAQFGIFLQSLFAYESVRRPTRELIYWSLQRPDVVRSTCQLASNQVKYWLRNDGKHYTHEEFVGLIDWWLRHPDTTRTVLLPFLKWPLEDPETLDMMVQSVSQTLLSKQAQVA